MRVTSSVSVTLVSSLRRGAMIAMHMQKKAEAIIDPAIAIIAVVSTIRY